MKLYNTLTRQTEDIIPLSAPNVSVYTCGPTVYDYPHIGNWFTFIRYDVLVRALKAAGYQPTWVMNLTDVGHLVSDADEGEDKLEKGAKREGKTAWDVAKFYGDYFIDSLARLNITQPDYLPKATEHIAEQIQLIQSLEQKGYTYVIDDGVYYDTSRFEGYAAFARLDLDDLQAGARVEFNQQKRNASDFALWKFSPIGQQRDMEWDSPWGKGFPGWHLECSAMSMKYLGDTIDIHSGGIDHVPVHHTNEIAQSEAATGKRFANYWMHTNHISVNGEKISKSLGNSITLEDIELKGYSLEVLRLHVLESHYQSQSKFSWDALEAAKNRLAGYREMASFMYAQPSPTDKAGLLESDLAEWQQKILAPLQEDLNTPQVLAELSNLKEFIVTYGIDESAAEAFRRLLTNIDHTLGLQLSMVTPITDGQSQLIHMRNKARQDKDWTKSDEIREQLAQQGIGLRDTSNGAIWYHL